MSLNEQPTRPATVVSTALTWMGAREMISSVVFGRDSSENIDRLVSSIYGVLVPKRLFKKRRAQPAQ